MANFINNLFSKHTENNWQYKQKYPQREREKKKKEFHSLRTSEKASILMI